MVKERRCRRLSDSLPAATSRHGQQMAATIYGFTTSPGAQTMKGYYVDVLYWHFVVTGAVQYLYEVSGKNRLWFITLGFGILLTIISFLHIVF